MAGLLTLPPFQRLPKPIYRFSGVTFAERVPLSNKRKGRNHSGGSVPGFHRFPYSPTMGNRPAAFVLDKILYSRTPVSSNFCILSRSEYENSHIGRSILCPTVSSRFPQQPSCRDRYSLRIPVWTAGRMFLLIYLSCPPREGV